MHKKIKNLVLGSEGFIGKPFCDFLESLGEDVIRFDIKRGAHEDARSSKLPLDGVDRVYFLAWDVGGSKYLFKQESLLGQIDWNLGLLTNTMKQLEHSGTPFLFVSSQFAEEYGTPYGATKRLGEIWTRLLPNGFYARQWNVYGTIEDTDERSHVISDFIHQALTKGEIRMISTGQERRQFVHLEDSFRAYHKILSEKIRGDIYDITSQKWVKIIDLANMIAELTGARVQPGDRIATDHGIFSFNKPVPGWESTRDLETDLPKMIEVAKAKFLS